MQHINVLLLTNYRSDNQYSMLRFGNLLTENIQQNEINIHEIFPKNYLHKFSSNARLKKLAGYIDKYIIFPSSFSKICQSLISKTDIIHIIDHSNAIYLPKLNRITGAKKIITCHDLIAIRTANGDFAQARKTSNPGKGLQNWISNTLHHANYYACDSRQTLNDLHRLMPRSKKESSVVHLGTEEVFSSSSNQENLSIKLPFDPSSTNFLLHVGSAAWYKNRKAVLRSFIHAHKSLPNHSLKLVLVGPEPQKEELDDQLKNWITSNPSAIYSLQNFHENTLDTLYKYAQALVFPSFIEGFGWPPLEAAIRGCPVITSRTGAIEDLLGNYAKYVEPENQQSIDQGVLQTLQVARSTQRAIALPSRQDCRKQYFDLYDQMMEN